MPTRRQQLGVLGEETVARNCPCPRCKRARTYRRLPANFKCADLICDFCGYLAQVKTASSRNLEKLPARVLGAAWGVQKDRMDAGIYFSLYLVLVTDLQQIAIYFLSADLQQPSMFVPRLPLSLTARRAGWQGFYYDFEAYEKAFVRLR